MSGSSAVRVMVMAGFDSSLKLAARLVDALAATGADCTLWAPTSVAPHRLGEGQIRAVTDRPVRFGDWAQLVDAAASADVVVPVYDGPTIERFIRDVHRASGGRVPVFGTGYVGMALNDLVGGYLMRSLGDVLAVNSRTDLELFQQAATALGLPQGNLLLTGLALLPAAPAPQRRGPIRTVLFADQPTVPRAEVDRILLWDRVLGYARLHPDRTVLLKPRHRPGEDTFHRMRVSPESWAAMRELPPNLRIDHTPVEQVVPTADLLVTVSSTAALEAIAHGGRVAFVADQVADRSLNPPLLPSGLLRRFDDIDADRIGAPKPQWLDDVFPAAHGDSPAARFAQRLVGIAGGAMPRVHAEAWDSAMHRSRRAVDEARAALRSTPRRRYTPRRLTAGALRRALALVDR